MSAQTQATSGAAYLLANGWTQWAEEIVGEDGKPKLVKIPFWQDPIGEVRSYLNESNQHEYGNQNRRYTLKEAERMQKLRDKTEQIRAEQKAEAEAERRAGVGITSSSTMTAAEAAAKAAVEAEAAQMAEATA